MRLRNDIAICKKTGENGFDRKLKKGEVREQASPSELNLLSPEKISQGPNPGFQVGSGLHKETPMQR